MLWNPPRYTYTTNNGTITITGYMGAGGAVTNSSLASLYGALLGGGRVTFPTTANLTFSLVAPLEILADTTLGLAEKGAALLGASTAVRIRTLDARGPFDDVQVRVELEPDPALPPGFELVRYYRMRYSSLTGWSHKGRGSALSYWLAFL